MNNNEKNIQKILTTRYNKTPNVENLNNMIAPDHIKRPFITQPVIKNVIDRSKLNIDTKRKELEDKFERNVTTSIFNFLKPETNWYLNFGGAGDLILLLASCYDDANAQVVFPANSGSIEFCKELLQYFRKDYFICRNIMGTRSANIVYDHMTTKPNFKTSGHLSRGLYFGDWPINLDYYEKNIRLRTGWLNEIGVNSFFQGSKLIVIQPSGSTRNLDRQRFLLPQEYNLLIKRYLDEGYTVITTGSDGDKEYYHWKPWTQKSYFLTSKNLFGYTTIQNITLETFLKTINSAERILSVDTWLKTYSALCGIETIVFQSRCRGSYLRTGSDVGDSIFLNTKWWPNMRVVKISEFINF